MVSQVWIQPSGTISCNENNLFQAPNLGTFCAEILYIFWAGGNTIQRSRTAHAPVTLTPDTVLRAWVLSGPFFYHPLIKTINGKVYVYALEHNKTL